MSMTPDALEDALATLGWTTGDLARFLECSHNRVRNWIRRDKPYTVPPDVAVWLQRRVALHQAWMRADPPPGSNQ